MGTAVGNVVRVIDPWAARVAASTSHQAAATAGADAPAEGSGKSSISGANGQPLDARGRAAPARDSEKSPTTDGKSDKTGTTARRDKGDDTRRCKGHHGNWPNRQRRSQGDQTRQVAEAKSGKPPSRPRKTRLRLAKRPAIVPTAKAHRAHRRATAEPSPNRTTTHRGHAATGRANRRPKRAELQTVPRRRPPQTPRAARTRTATDPVAHPNAKAKAGAAVSRESRRLRTEGSAAASERQRRWSSRKRRTRRQEGRPRDADAAATTQAPQGSFCLRDGRRSKCRTLFHTAQAIEEAAGRLRAARSAEREVRSAPPYQ